MAVKIPILICWKSNLISDCSEQQEYDLLKIPSIMLQKKDKKKGQTI